MKSKFVVRPNQCPECLAHFHMAVVKKVKVDLKGDPNAITLAVCHNCNHIICAGLTKHHHVIACFTLEHDFFHDDETFSDKDRQDMHELQEKRHFEAGHWG